MLNGRRTHARETKVRTRISDSDVHTEREVEQTARDAVAESDGLAADAGLGVPRPERIRYAIFTSTPPDQNWSTDTFNDCLVRLVRTAKSARPSTTACRTVRIGARAAFLPVPPL
ncbi:hypothetical protein GOSPT_024_00110 [Gordonia sputi NBRC 100414]|uniref:Uncharacterized protein n=1 Tax=Gordonia sputi NBRC 100414 TaxID=1089453 RepID=H5TWV2_9ACTN|nr:hypothetical protein GOSPT_024_00110 [Gordonia sputi NBRC 100414]